MSGFLGWLFGLKEQVAVAQEKAAPVVDDVPAAVDDRDGDYDWVSVANALVQVKLVGDEIRAMRQWLGSVESRLNEVERTLEEWSGE